MKTQIPNIDVVRSAWRRVKKDIKDAIIRDLVLRANPNTPKAALAPRAASKKEELHAASVVRPIRFPRDVKDGRQSAVRYALSVNDC